MTSAAPLTGLRPTLKGPHRRNFYQCESSTRATRWSGLLVERRIVPESHSLSYQMPVSLIGLMLSRSENRWRARGQRNTETWRSGTTVFLRAGFLIDECATTGLDHIVVSLEPDVMASLVGAAPARQDFLEHVVGNDRQVAGLLSAMYAEAEAGNPAGALFSESISIALITHLRDRYDRGSFSRRNGGRLSDRQVQTVRRYVRDHIDRDLSIVELAALVQLSPAYFCKAFAKTIGATPHRFVMNERVSTAKHHLDASSMINLSELAASLGFANRTHFSSVFRKLVGCSPSEYRSTRA